MNKYLDNKHETNYPQEDESIRYKYIELKDI